MSEKKTEAVNAYLIKNSKGEGGRGERRRKKKEKKGGGGGGGGGHSHKQSEVLWVHKIGLK